ncbi:endosomal SPRY domain protein [Rhodotorula toruloides]|uniref:Endosomal SPRY domain protein n=1 Tax=Rhodotorula toruloides TaxID=5286 RepID=A0A511KR11_RHOTO|nr:endosomal SPRY domain protein [Rhodotorula toruloides]
MRLPRQATAPPRVLTTAIPDAPALSHLPPLLRDSLPSDILNTLAQYDIADTRGTVKAVGEWDDEWPISPPARGGGGGAVFHGGDDWGVELPAPETGTPTQDRSDPTLAILIPLLVLLTLLLFLIFILTIVLLRRRRGIELTDDGSGPTNLEREDDVDGEGGLDGVEQRWLMTVDEPTRAGYMRAKVWQTQYPPNSQPTEITLTQFLSIQEKGVSAWSFEPDYESNSSVFVQSRTEISFLADGYGMAPEEGGGCCVQSNLPIPKLNDVYYFECKMYDKPETTNVSVGLATKPYPSFRLPGLSRYSVGYHSADGFKSHSFPFTSTSYGAPLLEGDVLGVGYRPRSGLIFFTRNGKKLEDAFVGFNKHNVFPTIGADGPCSVHVNLGQAGFVFIEANVKKWGLAPQMGTLAPPPAYGSEGGSILLESATAAAANASSSAAAPPISHHRRTSSLLASASSAAAALSSPTQPIRPSPLRHSHSRHASSASSRSLSNGSDGTDRGQEEEDVHNPPTPGLLDISLHSMHRFPDPVLESDEEERADVGSDEDDEERGGGEGETVPLVSPQQQAMTDGGSARSVSPPAYNPVDPYMYAPGVAETILEDAFAAAASASNAQGSSASPITPSAVAGYPGSSAGRPPLPGLSPQQVALVAQFAQQRRLMQQQLQAGGGTPASGASSPGYEARTAGPPDGANGAGGAAAGGLGGLLGWLTGRAQVGAAPESRAEQGQA